jgi:hypothetical protein
MLLTIAVERSFRSRNVMRLVNPSTGLIECQSCGHQHSANITPNSNGPATTEALGSARMVAVLKINPRLQCNRPW